MTSLQIQNNSTRITGGNKIRIRRNFLIEDSLAQLSNIDIRSVRIVFINEHGIEEDGIDGGGLMRDYLVTTINTFIETMTLFLKNKT